MQKKESADQHKGYMPSAASFELDDRTYHYYSVKVFDSDNDKLSDRLPRSLKLMLENSLNHYDERYFQNKHFDLFRSWDGSGGTSEISFMPSRVILQDFTGVPVVADLA